MCLACLRARIGLLTWSIFRWAVDRHRLLLSLLLKCGKYAIITGEADLDVYCHSAANWSN